MDAPERDQLLENARQRLGGRPAERLDVPEVMALIAEKQFDKAFQQALQKCAAAKADPRYAYWVGAAAILAGCTSEAAQWLQVAAEADPNDGRAHAALAFVSKPLGRFKTRVTHYRRAVELIPADSELRANFSQALLDTGQPGAAEREARSGLGISPGDARCIGALGNALQAQGRAGEAIRLMEARLKADDDRDVRWYLAHACLRAGRFREGFAAYEARRRPSRHNVFGHVQEPGLSHPEWRGDALAGRRLLVVCEQGLGDNIFAMRYAASLAMRGDSIAAVVPKALNRLLAAQNFPRKVFAFDEPIPRQEYDCWCFAMTLPGLLGEAGTPASSVPYILLPGIVRVDSIREPMPLMVGICWAGSPQNPEDALRSIPVQEFAPLAELPNVALVSCQHGVEPAELPPFIRPAPIALSDLADTAALISRLDLLITIDSAPAHLAGAMGRDVWLLARWFGDWRWGDSGSTTRWYPTMRILRQSRTRQWRNVISNAKSLLERRLIRRRAGNQD